MTDCILFLARKFKFFKLLLQLSDYILILAKKFKFFRDLLGEVVQLIIIKILSKKILLLYISCFLQVFPLPGGF